MKKNIKYLVSGVLCLTLGTSLFSCESYLDREPDSIISLDDAFKDFRNFQGFIEEIYQGIPNKLQQDFNTSCNWGDDELFNSTGQVNNNQFTVKVDNGDFRAWTSVGGGFSIYLYFNNNDPANNGKNHGLWQRSWYCIRKANLGLANLDKMVGTQEERDILAGQLYFFRAWWHFELMMWLGGLPYVDEVLDGGEQLRLPRLSYQECADKAAADFRRAADLLPLNWDDTTVGKATVGKNKIRLNKIHALGYLGKNYLWAASPLMEHGAQLGAIASGRTYQYNQEYARKAAEAFGELLSLVESGQTMYSLVEFNYSDIYNHTKAAGATTSYSDLFYTLNQSQIMPGSTEAIFQGPSRDGWLAFNTTQAYGPSGPGWKERDNITHHPTANAVDFYGMENGLPITDPESGFDPEYPFKGRDPRFYHDIMFDGFRYVNGALQPDSRRYCSLFTRNNTAEDPSAAGEMRKEDDGSRTGYLIQKIVPHTSNFTDKDFDWGRQHNYISYMRLAEVYLMYAEAAAAATNSATGKSGNFDKTAEDAVNVVRARVGAGNVASKFVADYRLFMDEIRRERAVELMFEAFRFSDLQRWLLLTEEPYNQKWAQDFTRLETDEWFTQNDPRNARVADWESGKRLILTRPLGTKHYWFPFPDDEVYLYPEFPQNPGW